MIPRIIHQTSRTTELPPPWRRYQSELRALHPGWEYRHWTDHENLDLVERSTPQLLSLYRSLPKGIMKADMIRYVYMAVFGGLYLDFDYEMLKPFDLLDRRLVLPRESDDGAPIYLGNAILASEPGHPFWPRVFRELERGLRDFGREPVEGDVPALTGPGLITRVYLQDLPPEWEIQVPRRIEFNPAFPANDAEYAQMKSAGVVYGIHRCHGSWRSKSVPQRVLRKLESLRIMETIKRPLRPLYQSVRDAAAQARFWLKRKWRKLRRRGRSFPENGTLLILCVKRTAYARFALKNINSLHCLYPGYRFRIFTDDACFTFLRRALRKLDYRDRVEVVNRFGASSEPWQFQKVACFLEAGRTGSVLVDADTIWHSEPHVDPRKVTFLVKAYSFGENGEEAEFLERQGMGRALPWPHFATGFISFPADLYSEELERRCMELTRLAWSEEGLRRLSDEIGINLAVQALVPADRIEALKDSDGPNDTNIMQSLYYGCANNIVE